MQYVYSIFYLTVVSIIFCNIVWKHKKGLLLKWVTLHCIKVIIVYYNTACLLITCFKKQKKIIIITISMPVLLSDTEENDRRSKKFHTCLSMEEHIFNRKVVFHVSQKLWRKGFSHCFVHNFLCRIFSTCVFLLISSLNCLTLAVWTKSTSNISLPFSHLPF